MKTTDPPWPSSKPVGMNLRLYLLAFLAGAYVLAWAFFSARGPAHAPSVGHDLDFDEPPRAATWLSDLPPALRPTVQVPPGWHLVEVAAASRSGASQDAPVPQRVRGTRKGRIRTRSS